MFLRLTHNDIIYESDFLIKDYSLKEVYYNNLNQADNSASLTIPYNVEIQNFINLYSDNNIKGQIIDGDNIVWTGYLRKNYNFGKKQRNEEIKLEFVSPSYLLDVKTQDYFVLSNTSLGLAVKTLLSKAGFSTSIELPEEIGLFQIQPDTDIKKALTDLLFNYGYCFDFDNEGNFIVFPLFNKPDTENISQVFDGSNCINEIKVTKKEQSYNATSIEWDFVELVENKLIFADTTGGNNETNSCSITIQPGEYLGEIDDVGTYYIQYDCAEGKVLNVKNGTLTIESTNNNGLTYSYNNLGNQGELSIYNGSSKAITITKLVVYGDAFVVKSTNFAKSATGTNYKDLKAEYIHKKNYAEELSKNYTDWLNYADYTVSLKSYTDFALGSFVKVTENGLGTIYGRITEKIYNIKKEPIQYTIEAISDYEPAEVNSYTKKQSSILVNGIVGKDGLNGLNGKDGANGKNGTNGSDGVGIKSITEYYLAISSSSGITTSTSGWTTSIQTVSSSKKYLWNYEKITFTDNSTTNTTPVIIGNYAANGTNGTNGKDGKGIKSITEHYLATTASSGVSTSTSGWSTTVQTMTATNKYLWNYETITYTDSSSTNTSPSIIGVYGDKGAKGDKGSTGATGPQGEKGDKGDKGATGAKGDKGDTGAQGPKGDKGDTGAQGQKGNNYWLKSGWIDLSASNYDVETWYPVIGTAISNNGVQEIKVSVQLNSGTKPSWSTHSNGFAVDFHVQDQRSGWGTTSAVCLKYVDTFNWTQATTKTANLSPVSYTQMTNSSFPVLYLRGGGKYFVSTTWNCSWAIKTSTYTSNSQSVSPSVSSRPTPRGTYIKGTNGVSMRNKGTWASGSEYVNNSSYIDVIYYAANGCSYSCKTSHTASSSILPTNTAYWNLLAEKGAKGDKGDTGLTGAQGLRGAEYRGSYSSAPTTSLVNGDWYLNTEDGYCYYYSSSNGKWNKISSYSDYRYTQAMADMINLSTTLTSNTNLKTAINAWIQNLVSGTALIEKLFAKSISVGNEIKSSNYLAGTRGFRIASNGNAEFNNGTFNGTINATSGKFSGIIEQNGLKNFMLGFINLYYISGKLTFYSNFCNKVLRMDSGRYLCLFKSMPTGVTYNSYYSVVLNQIGGSDVGYTNEDSLFNDGFSSESAKNNLYPNPLYRINVRAMDFKCRSISKEDGRITSAPIRYMINSNVYEIINGKRYYVPYATFKKISSTDREVLQYHYGTIDTSYKYCFLVGITDFNTDAWEDPIGGVSMTVTLQQVF